jgi:hypothetical protein
VLIKDNRPVRVHCSRPSIPLLQPGDPIPPSPFYYQLASDSLAKHASDQVDSRIAGRTPATARPLWSVVNHATASYTWNPDCWLADVDCTFSSPWNSYTGDHRNGLTLANTRVMFGAYHAGQLPIGATGRFVTRAGVTVTSPAITARARVGESDLVAYALGSAMPGTIKPARFLSLAGFQALLPSYREDNYFRSIDPALCIPIASFHSSLTGNAPFEYPASVADLTRVDQTHFAAICEIDTPADATRLAFSSNAVNHDSGRPLAGIIANGELYILSHQHLTGQGLGVGPSYPQLLAEINATIESLLPGEGQQITPTAPNGFPEYA